MHPPKLRTQGILKWEGPVLTELLNQMRPGRALVFCYACDLSESQGYLSMWPDYTSAVLLSAPTFSDLREETNWNQLLSKGLVRSDMWYSGLNMGEFDLRLAAWCSEMAWRAAGRVLRLRGGIGCLYYQAYIKSIGTYGFLIGHVMHC